MHSRLRVPVSLMIVIIILMHVYVFIETEFHEGLDNKIYRKPETITKKQSRMHLLILRHPLWWWTRFPRWNIRLFTVQEQVQNVGDPEPSCSPAPLHCTPSLSVVLKPTESPLSCTEDTRRRRFTLLSALSHAICHFLFALLLFMCPHPTTHPTSFFISVPRAHIYIYRGSADCEVLMKSWGTVICHQPPCEDLHQRTDTSLTHTDYNDPRARGWVCARMRERGKVCVACILTW